MDFYSVSRQLLYKFTRLVVLLRILNPYIVVPLVPVSTTESTAFVEVNFANFWKANSCTLSSYKPFYKLTAGQTIK